MFVIEAVNSSTEKKVMKFLNQLENKWIYGWLELRSYCIERWKKGENCEQLYTIVYR